MSNGREWTTGELQILRGMAHQHGSRRIAKALNRTPVAVNRMAARQKIRLVWKLERV